MLTTGGSEVRYGIGVRYSEKGVRLLKLDYSDKGLKITGVAAGQPMETMSSFFNAADFDRSNTPTGTFYFHLSDTRGWDEWKRYRVTP